MLFGTGTLVRSQVILYCIRQGPWYLHGKDKVGDRNLQFAATSGPAYRQITLTLVIIIISSSIMIIIVVVVVVVVIIIIIIIINIVMMFITPMLSLYASSLEYIVTFADA